jgi:hypothetical protein
MQYGMRFEVEYGGFKFGMGDNLVEAGTGGQLVVPCMLQVELYFGWMLSWCHLVPCTSGSCCVIIRIIV